tara:strand:- start:54 stop:596 length:543 start_codon:yes stop_codon:yes gene_type:complete
MNLSFLCIARDRRGLVLQTQIHMCDECLGVEPLRWNYTKCGTVDLAESLYETTELHFPWQTVDHRDELGNECRTHCHGRNIETLKSSCIGQGFPTKNQESVVGWAMDLVLVEIQGVVEERVDILATEDETEAWEETAASVRVEVGIFLEVATVGPVVRAKVEKAMEAHEDMEGTTVGREV